MPADLFPDPESAPGDGPLGFSYHLDPRLMLEGYRRGIFAWSTDPVHWWSPDPRAILDLASFHVPRRLHRRMGSKEYSFATSTRFDAVVKACAEPAPGRDETWISDEFCRAFSDLYQMGFALSSECYYQGDLVGGVFGVRIGRFFSGESMFHHKTDAGKMALVHLVGFLKQNGVELFDIQMVTSTTAQFGARSISRTEYLQRLRSLFPE